MKDLARGLFLPILLTTWANISVAHEGAVFDPPPEAPLVLPVPTETWFIDLTDFKLPAAKASSKLRKTRDVDPLRLQGWTEVPAINAWNVILTSLVIKHALTGPRASRAFALVHTGLHDALVAASKNNDVSEHAVMAGVAGPILRHLFPMDFAELQALEREAIDSFLSVDSPRPVEIERGHALGRSVASVILRKAPSDKVTAEKNEELADGPCSWIPTPPGFFNGEDPAWGQLKPWVLSEGDIYRPEAPPACGSKEFEDQKQEVFTLRAKSGARFLVPALGWADGPGTQTPVGHWLKVGLDLITKRNLSNLEASRVLSTLSVAGADSYISVWDAKYTYQLVRPISVFRDKHPDWSPIAITPVSPSYPAEHSAIAAASAEVLSRFFPDEAALLRDTSGKVSTSRVRGGFHYPVDAEKGHAMGRAIGWSVLAAAEEKGVISPTDRWYKK